MRNFPIVSMIILVSAACTSEIDIDVPRGEPEIVVNSLITNDKPCELYLTRTISINQNDYPIIDNANVFLVNDIDGFIYDTLKYFKNSIYKGTKILNLNTTYQLLVRIDNKEVSAKTYIPSPVPILSAELISPSGFDEYGDPILEYRISFEDPLFQENFYELFFINLNYSYNTFGSLIGESSSIRSNEFLVYIDPIIESEGLEDYENNSLIFSDKLFNGELTQLSFKYYNSGRDGKVSSLIDSSEVEIRKTYALLRSVSKEYFNYRKSWTIHRYTQQNKPAALEKEPLVADFSRFLFVGDPVTMKSEVINGLGLFAGYSQNAREIEKK